jgi:hypothetical protein
MQINIKKWQKSSLTRYYLTNELGADLGHVQEKTIERTANNHYDAHRITKGDTERQEVSHTVTDPSVLNAISHKNLNGEKPIDTALLNKHSGTYSIQRGKSRPVWIPSEPIYL